MGVTNATDGASAGGASSNGNVFIRCGSFGSDTTVAGATTASSVSVTGSSAGNVGSSRAGPGRLAGGLPPPECTRELDVGSWMEH